MNERAAGNWWLQNLLRPTLIAGMMACLTAPFVRILEWMMAPWDGTYFLVFAFFAALEGILSERLLQREGITGWGYLASRGAEALLLLLLLKVANYIPQGWEQLLADAKTWLADPNRFFSMLDLLTGALFLVLWMGALLVARQVRQLDVDETKVTPPPDKTSTEYYLWLTQPPPVRFYQEALDWLGEMFIWGGVAILLASALVHALVPGVGAPVLPVLLYFAFGVALLSQGRFSVSSTSWQAQGIPIQKGIGRRWLLWAVIFLVAVALVSLLLPTDYAMGPILALLGLIGIFFQVAMFLLTLIPYLLALLLSFLFPGMEQPTQPPPRLEEFALPEQVTTASSLPWLEILVSVVFWVAIVAIVGYALIRFLQDRWKLVSRGEEAEGSWRGRFLAWWRALWRWWRNWRLGVQETLARRREERREARSVTAALSQFLSLRRLSPRELVRYFYLSAARRAAQAGEARQPGQTPYEYQASLDGRFPDLEPDLTGLTDAFVQARYSPKPVHKEDAEEVKPLWQRIKAALRQRRAKP